ncbi:hypothetical protein PMAYCL1PPCAC_04818, partial [Pristionchus mayeri]
LAYDASSTVNPVVYQYICPDGFDLINGQCRGFVQQVECKDTEITDTSIEICGKLNGYPPIVKNDEENEYWPNYPRQSN